MENRAKHIEPALRAMTELQLSDWQQLGDKLIEQKADEASLTFVDKMTALLRSQLEPSAPDTHVRSTTHGDEAAFVVPGEETGLTKREYMATALMAGILANKGAHYLAHQPAGWAVEHADALINALNA